MLRAGDELIDAMGQVLAQIIGRGQERGVLTEDGEHRLSHALNQLFGQARDGLGVVAASRMGQPQETIQTRQADGLAELQELLAVEMKDLVEEPAQVVPVLGGKGDAGLAGFLRESFASGPSGSDLPGGGAPGTTDRKARARRSGRVAERPHASR